MTEGLSQEELLAELRTARFGRSARVVEETASTIDLAWEWLDEGTPEGAVVIAGRQTAGRGRLGRAWASPPGGLWMSVIARPGMSSAAAGRLGIGLAVAAAEGMREATGAAAKVKWPNDLVVAGRKLGGILVETRLEGDTIAAAVLSLGLNVNVSPSALPEEVRDTAVSVSEMTGRAHHLAPIAARILERLECLWPEVTALGTDLVRRWEKLDEFHGLEVEVATGDGLVRGLDAGLGLGGELIVTTEGGERSVAAGEVRSVRSAERCAFAE